MATAASTPETATVDDTAPGGTGLRRQAWKKADDARKAADQAYASTRDSAKKRPVAASAIAAGATAAIVGAVFGVTRIIRKTRKNTASTPRVKPSAS